MTKLKLPLKVLAYSFPIVQKNQKSEIGKMGKNPKNSQNGNFFSLGGRGTSRVF